MLNEDVQHLANTKKVRTTRHAHAPRTTRHGRSRAWFLVCLYDQLAVGAIFVVGGVVGLFVGFVLGRLTSSAAKTATKRE